jgi:polyhydroxyalkanoate synthesis regulator phasin
MTERDECIDRLVRASGGKISREEAMDALDELLARAERKGPDYRQINEKLAEAAQEMQDALIERTAILRRNERMDAMKSSARHRFYDRSSTPQGGLEAKLVGTNESFVGHRRSVDYAYRAKKREIMGGFELQLEREGVADIFAARALEREWATELHELNKPKGGRPGITNSPEALKIAEAIKAWQTASITAINNEGGWIKSYAGYITRTSHDPDKIRRAGGLKGDAARDQWVEDVMARVDVPRTFHDADPAAARLVLRDLWNRFVIGDHFDYGKPMEDLDGLLKVDFARKASAPRELHFKDADSWLEYNSIYGMNDPTAQVMASFDRGARSYSLLKEFGSQPRLAFEEDLNFLKSKSANNPDARKGIDSAERGLRNRFDQIDGSALRPINRTHARVVTGWMVVQRMAKLGLTPFAMLSDLATKASELRFQGATFYERWGSSLTGYFSGAPGSEKRQVAELLHASVAARIGDIATRFDAGDTPSGWLASAESMFFKYTGISPMTHNQRADSEVIMARHLGQNRGKAFEALGESEQRILKGFEIQKAEWDLLHKVEWNDIGGNAYLTPDVATKLTDDDVRAYLVTAGRLPKDAKGDSANFLIERTRNDLAQKLWTYFVDRGEFAVLEAGARERAILYQGTRSGTALGTALRLIMQFKQFPLMMMTKTWGREINGGQGTGGKIAGLAELFIASTFLGMVANALNQAAKGQDPTSVWKNKPASAVIAGMIRGGAGSIYGDFLLGEFSRHGHSAVETLAGPTFGQLNTLTEVWSDLTHMKAKAATAMTATRMVRNNLPFMNMIYTKAAFDYMIYFRLQEAINPGYLQRYERTMKEKAGIEFWLRPSQVSR